jgi:heptosyltransferase-3
LTPTIRFLRTQDPEGRIDVVVRRGTQGVLEANPDLSRVFLLPAPQAERRREAGRADFWALWRGVVGHGYDYAFDFSNSDRSRIWMLLGLARNRCAHDFSGELRWKRALYNRRSSYAWGHGHEVVKDFQLAADSLGRAGEPGPLVLNADMPAEALCARLPFLTDPRPRVVIHPTSRWAYKEWLPERWAAVADWLADRGYAVLLSSGPDPAEGRQLAEIQAHCRQAPACLPGQATLRELAWIIRGSALFCGVDTVAMHIAAAVRARTVALFGPSSEWSWRPWQTRHELVLGPCTCKQTRRFVCDKSRPYPCMQAITVPEVLAAIERVLAGC